MVPFEIGLKFLVMYLNKCENILSRKNYENQIQKDYVFIFKHFYA